MHYDHDAPPEQTADRFIRFVDSFNSPWVGMYYDIGNHWKYGQPRQWLNAFGRRAVKLDVKGFSRAQNKFVDITSADDDLPWKEVQQGPGRNRLHRLDHGRGGRRRPGAAYDHSPADAKRAAGVA